jgi:hypothetical protein
MAYDYIGSLSQKYILFVTTVVVLSTPGANFSKVMIFMDEGEAAANFVVDPGVDTITELTPANWSGLLKATGGFWGWINGFYALNSVTHVFVVTFNDGGVGKFTNADLSTQYALYEERAYFKLMYDTVNAGSSQIALATLCGEAIGAAGDPLSQYLFGTSDPTTLTGTLSSPGTQVGWFRNSNPQLDVPIAYHPSSITNAALMQLGATLAVANATGTSVGNKLDWLAMLPSKMTPSGAGGTNLSAIQAANLQAQGVAFYTFVGDNSGNCALEKWGNCVSGFNFGASWVQSYIDVVTSQNGSTLLTVTAQSGFKNNDTYQQLLNVLQVNLNLFISIGRLAPLTPAQASAVGIKNLNGGYISAPPFNLLPAASGSVIIVPQAWAAQYLQDVTATTIYGTLVLAA